MENEDPYNFNKKKECQNSNVPSEYLEQYDWNYYESGEGCKYFEPVLFETECGYCRKDMKINLDKWPYWILYMPEYITLCSTECGLKLYDYLNQGDEGPEAEYIDLKNNIMYESQLTADQIKRIIDYNNIEISEEELQAQADYHKELKRKEEELNRSIQSIRDDLRNDIEGKGYEGSDDS